MEEVYARASQAVRKFIIPHIEAVRRGTVAHNAAGEVPHLVIVVSVIGRRNRAVQGRDADEMPGYDWLGPVTHFTLERLMALLSQR